MSTMLARSPTVNTTVEYPGRLSLLAFDATSRSELFSRPEVQRDLSDLLRAFAQTGGRLLSFDVFDTLLLRNLKSEFRRFLEISELFSISISSDFGVQCDAAGVLYARMEATRISYSFSQAIEGCREGRLEDIHLGIVRLLNLPDDYAAQLMKIELNYEIENLSPNPSIRSMLDVAEECDLKIVLISDMYMGKVDIAFLVEAHYPGVFRTEQIYSSADFKVSKKSGRLFDLVANEVGVMAQQALHVGDNPITDYACARDRGWQALYLPHTDKEYQAIAEDELLTLEELLSAGVDYRLLLAEPHD